VDFCVFAFVMLRLSAGSA